MELRILWINPPPGSLAPALSELTSLTKLFIRQPHAPEQAAMPCSLVEMTVAQQLPPIGKNSDSVKRRALPPLSIGHLTSLKVLTIKQAPLSQQAGLQDADDLWPDDAAMFGAPPALAPAAAAPAQPSVGITDAFVLPASLKRLVVRGLESVEPLLGLPKLKTVQLTHADLETDWQQLSQLSRVSALQQLALPAGDKVEVRPMQLHQMARAVSSLNADYRRLVVVGGKWEQAALQGLAGLTGLVSLTLKNMKGYALAAPAGAPIHVLSHVTPNMLATALSALTSLTEFELIGPQPGHDDEDNEESGV
jgi:hypothetical protein